MVGSDLDIESIRQELTNGVIGREIYHHNSVGSTMDEARLLAEQGVAEGVVVIAEEQTSGRGRFNRKWISPPGENLSFSVLLRPVFGQLAYMNMAATLAVVRAVAKLTGCDPGIKWPNDVRIDGRKISGILIETALEAGKVRYAIVGIGVNVNLDPHEHPEIGPIATSISSQVSAKVDRTLVLKLVLEFFDEFYEMIKNGVSLTEEWAGTLETLGRIVQLRWLDQVVEGKAEAVDEKGNLLLRRSDGSVFTAVAGEVTLQV